MLSVLAATSRLRYYFPATVHYSYADFSFVGSENRDKVEMYLAFGASRFEACRPIATEALRLALTPTINQMRCASPFILSISRFRKKTDSYMRIVSSELSPSPV